MTDQQVAVWLGSLEPPPPAALKQRLTSMLRAARSDSDAMRMQDHAPDMLHERLLAAGITGLADMLDAGATTREAALDLLTVDALITYAFEYAADDADTLDARAADAMARIASLGTPSAERARPQ